MNRMLKDVLKYQPYEYQKTGIRKILKHKYYIIGDEMGLGKSLQAIAVQAKLNLRTLVICPAYLRRNWENEFRKFTYEESIHTCHSKNDIRPNDSRIIIGSYSQLEELSRVYGDFDYVILDEVHYLKSPDAKRTEIAHDWIGQMAPSFLCALSGTTIKNRVQEYYSILSLCSYNRANTNGKDIFTDYTYWEFCNAFCFRESYKIRGRKITKFEGIRNIPLLRSYLKDKYIRRKADDVLELPPIIEKDVVINYKNDKKLQDAWDAEEGKKKHISTAKRDSAVAKVPFAVKYITDLREETDGPVIAFSDHPKVCELLSEKMKKDHKVAVITGKTPVNHRAEIVERFQAGEIDLLCATIGSASTGYTLTKTSHIVSIDRSWVPGDNAQMKKRIHRIGQEKKCFIHNLVGSKTDLTILKALDKKSLVLEKIL